jgi:hypothetical protein
MDIATLAGIVAGIGLVLMSILMNSGLSGDGTVYQGIHGQKIGPL